jgi:hypothetical protein
VSVSILSSISTHIFDKRYISVTFLDQNCVCIPLQCVLCTATTILIDLATLIRITWSCPIRSFLNPQYFHNSNDFAKPSQYTTVLFRGSQIDRILQNKAWSIPRACTTDSVRCIKPRNSNSVVSVNTWRTIKTQTPIAATRSHLLPTCFFFKSRDILANLQALSPPSCTPTCKAVQTHCCSH